MLSAILTLAGLGAVASLGLGIASRVFAVQVDPRLEPVVDLLPGANCGGCGLAGCAGYGELLVSGKAQLGMCPVNAAENDAAIAKILGVSASKKEKQVAVLHCQGDYTRSVRRYQYLVSA